LLLSVSWDLSNALMHQHSVSACSPRTRESTSALSAGPTSVVSRLVVWDCDGVLVDSEALLKRGEVKALAAAGIEVTVDDCVRLFSGVSVDQAAANFKRAMNKDLPAGFFAEQVAASMSLFRQPGELKALMARTVSELHRLGVPQCVASGSPRSRVKLCLEMAGIDECFRDEAIFTREQVSRGKPAPDLFLLAASQMGCRPADCLVVEDAGAGILAARGAGMPVIAYLGGGHAQSQWYRASIEEMDVPVFSQQEDVLRAILAHMDLDNSDSNMI
jgi:beta-phosphoglucomutase-like phosphatase (HAD superfamily)